MLLTNDLNKENLNSKIFLDYIISRGFNPEKYKNIIEVNGSANESMSQFLKDYNQYLISKKVVDNDLDRLGISGFNGYLNKSGIVAQEKKEYKLLYTPVRGIHQLYIEGYPKISDDDVFIANGINIYMDNFVDYKQDKYIGFCMDTEDPELVPTYYRFRDLQMTLNRNFYGEKYVLEHDSLSYKGKALLLIRKK